MPDHAPGFDPDKYKANTRDQWNRSSAGYNAWGETLNRVIGESVVHMMEMAAIDAGHQVLELAAGSGMVTLALAARVGANGRVLATDIAPDFLALAAENARAAGVTNVDTREMDGEAVDVPEGSFDAAVSSLGLMFFPDPVRSLQGQRQAVKPGGRVAALVISAPEKNPFFAIPAKLIRERAGLPLPQPGQPGPFALGAPGAVEAAFRQAGLRDVQSQAIGCRVELPSTRDFLRFLGAAFGALHMLMARMDDAARQATWDAVADAMAAFEGPQGFRCPAEMIVCAGTC